MSILDIANKLNDKRNEIMAMRLAAIDKGTDFKKFNKAWKKAELDYFNYITSLTDSDRDLIVKNGNKELVTFRKII